MIVTVTMNAALDRTLTVPNFKEGQRHRASEKLTLAGGKGITVAPALKILGVPVVATGLAGGRNGQRIMEESAEVAILADFVRIEDESRTSTAVADPTSGTFTEVMEWGPPSRNPSSRCSSRSSTTSRAGPSSSSSRGRSRGGSPTISTPRRSAPLRDAACSRPRR